MPSHRQKNISAWPLHIKILFGLCVLLISFTLMRTWLFHGKSTRPLSLPYDLKITKTPNLSNPDDWKKMINISGVTLQNKGNITELTFLLDHEALYRLVSNAKENQLMIFIDRTKLKSELPPIVYADTAITKITAKQLQYDTEFILTFAPGASLKEIHTNDIDGNSELVISAISTPHIETAEVAPEIAEPEITLQDTHKIASDEYQNALLHAESGHFDLAINKLYSLLKSQPEHKEARVSLIAILIDQNNIAAAEVLVKDGMKLEPSYAPYAKLKARIDALRHHNKQAMQDATENV